MPPPKWRTGPGLPGNPPNTGHQRATERPSVKPTGRTGRDQPPRAPLKRVRPRSHSIVGALLLIAGATVIVLNYAIVLGGVPKGALPGGHSEGYLILGLAIAGSSTWWFGWFDRGR